MSIARLTREDVLQEAAEVTCDLCGNINAAPKLAVREGSDHDPVYEWVHQFTGVLPLRCGAQGIQDLLNSAESDDESGVLDC